MNVLPDLTWSQMQPLCTLILFFKIHFNVILPSLSAKLFLSLAFLTKYIVYWYSSVRMYQV